MKIILCLACLTLSGCVPLMLYSWVVDGPPTSTLSEESKQSDCNRDRALCQTEAQAIETHGHLLK
jgi:hypothetical protein